METGLVIDENALCNRYISTVWHFLIAEIPQYLLRTCKVADMQFMLYSNLLETDINFIPLIHANLQTTCTVKTG